jgi:hypothetical protein
MAQSKLSRYPASYSKILLALPENGTPIDIPLSDELTAAKERLRFYNFLKFLRRNQNEAAHFGSRHNLVVMHVVGNVLRFSLRNTSVPSELEAGFEDAVKRMNLPSDFTLPVIAVPDKSAEQDLDAMLQDAADPGTEPANPFDIIEEATNKEKKS